MGGGPTGFAAHCNPMAKEAPTTARAKMSVVPAYVGRAARQVGRCDRGKPQPPEPVAKRFASRRAAWIANEQQLAARCYRRASHWLSRDS